MSESYEVASLVDALLGLYHELVNRMLLSRSNAYRPAVQSAASGKLARQLHEYIRYAPAPKRSGLHPEPRPRPAPDPEATEVEQASPVGGGLPEGELGLTELHYRHITEESIGNKLMHGTLEHLHASLRLVRLGDKKASLLHADLMENALKEAAHFLDREEYRQFVQELAEHLAEHKRRLDGQEYLEST